ncbi:hypothetical protein TBLA_0G01790 [Henningerozyma blattae CBS 6284]|uniref:GTPase-activating protein GYP5 n=1 Tax=Henningerozyma blattae (strain ATCC 34711 / CBS 6284 / DSM 70876 / NBRC 10599 / NRRL Y-10934 / UCD 77-7) TaxID=1071380 RepID=I2H6X0_HENB6|nr:hypothetical protein TBLA_0G01790 [Tetrapisispora blattae CBS 6284]CCH62122.1 hypothetical protein TBLA_0G01790 [Tetrapisispora blattae CBS 6284]
MAKKKKGNKKQGKNSNLNSNSNSNVTSSNASMNEESSIDSSPIKGGVTGGVAARIAALQANSNTDFGASKSTTDQNVDPDVKNDESDEELFHEAGEGDFTHELKLQNDLDDDLNAPINKENAGEEEEEDPAVIAERRNKHVAANLNALIDDFDFLDGGKTNDMDDNYDEDDDDDDDEQANDMLFRKPPIRKQPPRLDIKRDPAPITPVDQIFGLTSPPGISHTKEAHISNTVTPVESSFDVNPKKDVSNPPNETINTIQPNLHEFSEEKGTSTDEKTSISKPFVPEYRKPVTDNQDSELKQIPQIPERRKPVFERHKPDIKQPLDSETNPFLNSIDSSAVDKISEVAASQNISTLGSEKDAGPGLEPPLAPTKTPITEPVVEPVTKPAIESVVETEIEPKTKPTVEPKAEPPVGSKAEPTVEPKSKPTVEPVVEPVIEPVLEPVSEPAPEPAPEPVSKPVNEPIIKQLVEPVAEPINELVTNPTSKLVTEPVAETAIEPAVEPVSKLPTELITEPEANPIAESVARPAAESIVESIAESDVTPIVKPEIESIIPPTTRPIEESVAESVSELAAKSVTEPHMETAPLPVSEPVVEHTSNRSIGRPVPVEVSVDNPVINVPKIVADDENKLPSMNPETKEGIKSSNQLNIASTEPDIDAAKEVSLGINDNMKNSNEDTIETKPVSPKLPPRKTVSELRKNISPTLPPRKKNSIADTPTISKSADKELPKIPERPKPKYAVPPPLSEEMKNETFRKNVALTHARSEPPKLPPNRPRGNSKVADPSGLSKNAEVNLIASRFKATSSHYNKADQKDRDQLDQGQNILRDSYASLLKTLNLVVNQDTTLEPPLTPGDDENALKDVDWTFWTQVVNDFPTVASNEPEKLEERITNGIPSQIRGIIWQLIANSKSQEFEDIYTTLSTAETPHEANIRRDIRRTNFVNESKTEALFNVIKVYSIYDPDVGYTQGMAFIAAPLILNFEKESDAFGLLVRLMKSYGLRDFFLTDMPGLMITLYQFDRLLEENSPMLYSHLGREGIRSTMYATQWFLTFFAYKFPLGFVLRIYDIIFVEGIEVILKFAVILMLKNQEKLKKLKFDKLLEFLKGELFNYYLKDKPLENSDDNASINTYPYSTNGTVTSPSKKSSSSNIKTKNTDKIDVYNYNIDQFVKDAINEVTITPISLNRYKEEYYEIHEVEKQKEEQYETVRIQNKQLQKEVKKLEHDYTVLNREHVQIANELINNRLKTETLADENNDLKLKILELKKNIEEKDRKAKLSKPDSNIPIDLKEDLERTMKRNSEVMNENMRLQDRVELLESRVEDLLRDKRELQGNILANDKKDVLSETSSASHPRPHLHTHDIIQNINAKTSTSPSLNNNTLNNEESQNTTIQSPSHSTTSPNPNTASGSSSNTQTSPKNLQGLGVSGWHGFKKVFKPTS